MKQTFLKNKRETTLYGYWVTNKQLIAKYEDFFQLDAPDKLRFYNNYKDAFHRNDEGGMIPIFDRMNWKATPIAYVDKNGTKYDIFYSEKMELLPQFPMPSVYLLGASTAEKMKMILSAPRALELILKYLDGAYWECAYPFGTPERSCIMGDIKRFQKNQTTECDLVNLKVQKLPLQVICGEKLASVMLTAESNEVSMKHERSMIKDEIVFLFSGEDCERMIQGDTETETMEAFNQLHYELRMGELAQQNVNVIFTQIDKLKHIKNEHLQNILAKNTIDRDEEGNLILHNKGVLDEEGMKWMQHEMLLFLKETCPLFYGKLKQIACYCNVEIFVNAQSETPFRTDEFWLCFLQRNGIVKGSKKESKWSDLVEWMKGDE